MPLFIIQHISVKIWICPWPTAVERGINDRSPGSSRALEQEEETSAAGGVGHSAAKGEVRTQKRAGRGSLSSRPLLVWPHSFLLELIENQVISFYYIFASEYKSQNYPQSYDP